MNSEHAGTTFPKSTWESSLVEFGAINKTGLKML
uniref:Uncharacterized protein n=1 Tax=Kalanchoe fedtschenkoi TaxID=63787 RepID=A0A7N0U025_KALFE